MGQRYKSLLSQLRAAAPPSAGMRVHSVELVDSESGALVAGEIGYAIGRTYTSLSGFHGVYGAEGGGAAAEAPAPKAAKTDGNDGGGGAEGGVTEHKRAGTVKPFS